MAPMIRLIGPVPALAGLEPDAGDPPRLTQPWLLLLRLAIPEITAAELPTLPAGERHVPPSATAQVYAEACRRARRVALEKSADLTDGARGLPREFVRTSLTLSSTGLTSLTPEANRLLAEAGLEPMPGGRGPLVLPNCRTDLDAFFEMLAAGDYRGAIDLVRSDGGIRDVLEGTSSPWLERVRLLYARGVDGALAELAADAEAAPTPGRLRQAAAAVGERMTLGPRLSGGKAADAQRQQALTTRREHYFRLLRKADSVAAPTDRGSPTLLRLQCEAGVDVSPGASVAELCRTSGGTLVRSGAGYAYWLFDTAGAALDAATEVQQLFEDPASVASGARVRLAIHTVSALPGAELDAQAERLLTVICAAARPGQVLVSDAAASALQIGAGGIAHGEAITVGGGERAFRITPHAASEERGTPQRGDWVRHTNLPDQLSSFVGRDLELADLRELTSEHRLVTLTGTGGVGKTRLGLELATEYLRDQRSEVWLVDLAALIDEALVGSTIAEALGVTVAPGRPLLDCFEQTLADRRLLVVLDNCEHVIATAADLASGLLRRCNGVSLLATSREPLHIAGEHVYRVSPLATPAPDVDDLEAIVANESVRLFAERVRERNHSFVLDAPSATTVARICRRLDGIPLAVELAAVRVDSMSVADLDRRLHDRFALLTGGARTALPRHRTLEAMIDWSYQSLSASEQTILARLSVFASGGFDLAAAEAVCGGDDLTPARVLDDLDALVRKNLVQLDYWSAEGRYRLLETIREYADAKLAAGDVTASAAARGAHREWYALIAANAAAELNGPDQLEWLDRLSIEHDNIRLALSTALAEDDPTVGIEMATALTRFWRARGHAAEGVNTLRQQLDRPDPGGRVLERARGLAALSYLLATVLSDFDHAAERATEAMAIGRQVADDRLIAECLKLLALIAIRRGAFDEGLRVATEATAVARPIGDQLLLAELANTRGAALINLGREARPEFEESLVLARQQGDRGGIATALNNLGSIDVTAGNLDAARSRLQEALAIWRELGQLQTASSAAANLGFTLYRQGDVDGAAALFLEVLFTSEREGDPGLRILSLLGLALTCPDDEPAAQLHGAVDTLLEQIGYELEHVERPLHDLAQERLRASLGTESFRAADAAGRALSAAGAIQLARDAARPSRVAADHRP